MLQKVVLLATYIMARSVPPTYNVSGDPPGALPGDPSGGPSGSLSGGPSGGSACRRLRMTNTDSTIKWLRSALQRSVRTPNEECSACLFLSLRGPSGSPPGALRGPFGDSAEGLKTRETVILSNSQFWPLLFPLPWAYALPMDMLTC